MSLDPIFVQAIEDGAIPGAVMLASNLSGSFKYEKVLGKLSVKPGNDKPLQLNSIMTLASFTKLLSTISALHLVDRGLIGLDQDVSEYVPVLAKQPVLLGFGEDGAPILEKRKNDITLRLLLTHSAGTSYGLMQPEIQRYLKYVGERSPDGYMDTIFDYPLLFQPGEGWSYGTGTTWAGRIVEKLSGLTLGDYIKQNLLKPLGLSRITFNPAEESDMEGQVSDLSILGEDGKLSAAPPGLPFFGPIRDHLGGEGAFGDLSHYAGVIESIFRDDGKILKSETVQAMFQPQLTDAARAGLKKAMEDPSWAVGNFTGPNEYDWGLGGILIAGDGHPFRKRGTLIWSGAANLFWFMDREAGVCGVFGTQVLPAGEKNIERLISAFERYVYADGAKA